MKKILFTIIFISLFFIGFYFKETVKNNNLYGAGAPTSNKKSITQIVTCPTGVNEENDEVIISASPNPTEGMLRVDLGSFYDRVEISLYTITGAEVLTQSFDNQQYINLNIEQLIPGVYVTKIETPLSIEVIRVIKK